MENKKTESQESKIGFWGYIFIILGIVLLIVLFLITLGRYNAGKNPKAPKEFREDLKVATHRNRKLKEHLKKQESLKKRLDKYFKWIYLSVRTTLVLLWAGLMFILYRYDIVQNIEDLLNFSELSLIILFTLNFLTFGTLTNLSNYINLIEKRTQNWVYGKYVNISNRINKTESQIISNQ